MKSKFQIELECKEVIRQALLGYIEECKMYNVEHPNSIKILEVKDVTRDLYDGVLYV